MRTKREIYEDYTKHGFCHDILCDECPFFYCNDCVARSPRLKKIGAMAILRMFKKKKKPLLSVGAKIKFSDGRIATLVKIDIDFTPVYYRLDFGDYVKSTDYLVGKTWEVVE